MLHCEFSLDSLRSKFTSYHIIYHKLYHTIPYYVIKPVISIYIMTPVILHRDSAHFQERKCCNFVFHLLRFLDFSQIPLYHPEISCRFLAEERNNWKSKVNNQIKYRNCFNFQSKISWSFSQSIHRSIYLSASLTIYPSIWLCISPSSTFLCLFV